MKRAAATLMLAGFLGACGGSSTDGTTDLSKFLGTWNLASGILATICDNGYAQLIPMTGPTTFVAGTTSQLLDTDPVCPVRYDVSGSVATAQPGQSCDHPQVITTLNIENATFTTTDGTNASYTAGGRQGGYDDITLGRSVHCTWGETATYQRSAP
jgi:hypothetical protein